jgi:hypothetical protein
MLASEGRDALMSDLLGSLSDSPVEPAAPRGR